MLTYYGENNNKNVCECKVGKMMEFFRNSLGLMCLLVSAMSIVTDSWNEPLLNETLKSGGSQ